MHATQTISIVVSNQGHYVYSSSLPLGFQITVDLCSKTQMDASDDDYYCYGKTLKKIKINDFLQSLKQE